MLINNRTQFPSPFKNKLIPKAKPPLTIKKNDLFVTELWELDLPDHEKVKKAIMHYINSYTVAEEFKEWKDKNPSTTTYGGFELELEDEYYVEGNGGYIKHSLKPLKQLIDSSLKKSLQQIESSHVWEKGRWEVEYWLNVNKTGGYNPPHIHPDRHYSGTYYIHTPKGSGNINFLDPRSAHRFSSPEPDSESETNGYAVKNKYDASVHTYEPEEGKLVIFPSWLMHYVDPNPTDKTRISLAFNGRYLQDEIFNPGTASSKHFVYG